MPEGERQRQSRSSTSREPARGTRVSLKLLFRVASVAGGIQFGWALQLSLLTPYVQELGIPHAWASIIWLCGPLSGLFVQPLVGLISDRCTSRFGRRRPFILGGAIFIIVAVLIIGFSADIGWLFGDRGGVKVRAIAAFVVGFSLLDVANNVTQGPCRALLADLTKKDHRRTRVANAYFSLFMAAGNILGYATGSYSGWYKIFPFTLNDACAVNCANLKAAFLLDIIFIVIATYISLSAVKEEPLSPQCATAQTGIDVEQSTNGQEEPFLWELFGTFKYFPSTVWIILLVTMLTWIAWFPFTLFDTDWVGREIYGGEPNGANYSNGVRMGSLGLMLNSVVLGLTSVFMEKLCGKWGAGFAWGVSNIVLSLCFIAMLVITAIRNHMDITINDPPPNGIVIAVLIVFTILGVPLSITYSVPYALVSSHIENLGLGQGLSMGVLNLAIVIPQILVSIGSGPWDELFGGGNSPAFVVAAISAFAAGLVAILAIPRTRIHKQKSLP
ncbi:unnamed protein product [Cuscuta europaea]|uniref:Major facilitator superfamily (MFS) profile domain-containing protein n=1 Tax=Cuscuta europaea TaxID=41803 RepID=A0A9P1E4N5_CUSEU|nr:unnamed protein product [Cuscuta europaea]